MIRLITSTRTVLVAAQLFTLMACTQSLSIETESDVPTPLVTQLPLNIGVYYDEQFRNYTYEEDSKDRPNWSIKNGASQVEFFDKILASMFKNIRHVNGNSDGQGNDLDAILAPHVAEMQFAIPKETKTDLYEAWIKYEIQLYQPDGELIAVWPVTAYGKSSTEFLQSREEGLQEAINLAFRDAGAKLTLNFERVAGVKQWLAGKTGSCDSDVTNVC